MVFALALCLTASASTSITAETYDQIYVGEYETTEISGSGAAYTGEAYIVFGKVTGTTTAGIILERYAVTDSSCATLLESKYYNARDGRITSDGEFAIALFNVKDGYYKAKVVAGDYNNPAASGNYVKFSKGVATYNVKFYKLDGTDEYVEYNVSAGSTVLPPEIEREDWVLTGWNFSSKVSGSFDSGFRDGGWGQTYASAPSNFVVNQDRVYSAIWDYVGENGDGSAPEQFLLSAKGYDYIVADTVNLAAPGSVGVMSFDVLETVSAGATTYLGTCGATSPPPYNHYTLTGWALYTDNGGTSAPTHCHSVRDLSNVTRATENIFSVSNIMKEGNSVRIVYSPYRSETQKGYLYAYVKSAKATEYTLFAGYENMNATQAPTGVMPCIATLTNIEVPLRNFHTGVDTDGDYSTLEKEYGINAFSTATSSPTTARYVNFDTNYKHSLQREYRAKMSTAEQTSSQAIFMSDAFLSSDDMAVESGEYFEMTYTVKESNVDEHNDVSFAPSFGFGFCHAPTMNTNFSGRHGYGMTIGWTNGTVTAFGGLSSGFANSANLTTKGYNVGMKTLLTAGTEVRVQIALDTTDDEIDTGYTKVFYKTSAMDDFALAGEMYNVGISDIGKAVKGGYPMFFVQYVEGTDPWRLDMEITGVSFATYNSSDEVTSKGSIALGSSFTPAGNSVERVDNYIRHTVSFIGPDGNVLFKEKVQSGGSLETPDDSKFYVTGYEWGGLDGEYDFTNITENITVYSKWTEIIIPTYTVDFYLMDGTSEKVTKIVEEGDTAVPPELTRDGYELTGWMRSLETDGEYDWSFRNAGWGTTYESSPSYFGPVTQNRRYAPIWKWVGEDGDAMAPAMFKLSADGYSYFTANSDDGLADTSAVGVMSFEVLSNVVGTCTIGTTGTDSPGAYNHYTYIYWALYNDNGTSATHAYSARDLSNVTRSTANVFSGVNILKEGNHVQVVYRPYRSETTPGFLRVYVKGANDSNYTLYAGWENMNASQAKTTTMPCLAAVNQEFSVALANVHTGIDTDGDYSTLETEYGVATFANGNTKSYDRYVDINSKELGSVPYDPNTDKALMLVANGGSVDLEWYRNMTVGDSVVFDVDNGTGLDVKVGEYTLSTSTYRSYKLEVLANSIVLSGWNGTELVTVDSVTATISSGAKFAFSLKTTDANPKQVFIDNVVFSNGEVLDFNYSETPESQITLDEMAPGKFKVTTTGYSKAYIHQDDFKVNFYDVEGGEIVSAGYYGYGKRVDIPEGYALVDSDDADKLLKVEADSFIALRKVSTTLTSSSETDRSETLYGSSTYSVIHDDSENVGANDYVHYFPVNSFNLGDKVKVSMDVYISNTSDNSNNWSTSVFKTLAGERIDDALPVETLTKLTFETRVVSTEDGLAAAFVCTVDEYLEMSIYNVSIVDSKITTKLLGGATLYMLPNDIDMSNEQMNSFVLVTASGKVIVMDGGTHKDYIYLRDFLHSMTDKVDAWFISHYHSDHIGALAILLNQKDIYIDKLYYDFPDHEILWGEIVDESIVIDEDFGFESYDEMTAKGFGGNAGNSSTLNNLYLGPIYSPKYGDGSSGEGKARSDRPSYLYCMFYDEVQKNLALPEDDANRVIGEVVKTQRGDVFTFDDVEFRILNSVQRETANYGNNTTINWRINTAGVDMLFLGDSGIQVGTKLIEDTELIFDDNGDGIADSSVYDNLLGCTIVQAAHHGQNGVTETFYNTVKGDVYIYCAPEGLFYQATDGVIGAATTQCLKEREWQRKMGTVGKTYWMDGLVTIK